MILHSPVMITSRLMAGVQVGEATISIGYAKRPGREGRVRAEYWIDLPDGSEHYGDDLQSGCQGAGLQELLGALLCFLNAAGESYCYDLRTGGDGTGGENSDMFPLPVVQWAADNGDELAMMRLTLEEGEQEGYPAPVLIEE